MKIPVIVFFVLSVSVFANAQNCKYDKNGTPEVPCVFEQISFVGVKVRNLNGKVVDQFESVIVGSKVSLQRVTKVETIFIGSQIVNSNGKFCFNNLKPGKYILKIGYEGFKCSSYELTVMPKNKRLKSNLTVKLEIGV
jgi:hypothetical protein